MSKKVKVKLNYGNIGKFLKNNTLLKSLPKKGE